MLATIPQAFTFLLLAFCVQAKAQTNTFYVSSSTGVDTGDCRTRPCRTCQYALRQTPGGQISNVIFSAGYYFDDDPNADAICNVHYHRTVSLTGDCSQPDKVVFLMTRPGTTAFWIQDHAIGVVECLKIESLSTGNIGIAGRQRSTVDYGDITFGVLTNGQHIAGGEFTTMNCTRSVVIAGDAAIHASIGALSIFNLGCRMNIPNPRYWSIAFVAAQDARINAVNATFSGADASESSGNQCLISGILRPILPAAALPGWPNTCNVSPPAN